MIIAALFYITYPHYVEVLPYFGLTFNSLGYDAKYVGMAAVAVSVLHVLAGYLLWKFSKKGGYIGIIVSIIGLISFAFSYQSPSMGLIFNGAFVAGAVLLTLIVLGWDSLN